MASNPHLRGRIMDAARHLLASRGYAGLSMRPIARHIGYSATTIYHHFESKDALVHALIGEGMQRLHAALRDAAAAHEEAPVQRLESLCRRYISFGLEEPESYEIMFLLHSEQMERYPAAGYRRARRSLELIERALTDGREAGCLAVEETRVAAAAIWAALHGAVSLIVAQRVDARMDQQVFIDTVVRRTLQGYVLPQENVPS